MYLFVVLWVNSKWPWPLITVNSIRERISEHDEASYQGKMATVMVVSQR